MDEETREELIELFRLNSARCVDCPYYAEYAERAVWLHPEEEGRVVCGLIAGMPGNPERDCGLWRDREEL